jgi:hypothetical protein
MKNNNLEMATAELRQALTNFLNMARTGEGIERRRAEECYNDMTTWFNWFIVKADMQTLKLDRAEVSEEEEIETA